MTQAARAPLALPGPTPLWRHAAFRWTIGVAGLAALSAPLWWTAAAPLLFGLELTLAGWLPEETVLGAAWFLLPLLGFGSGLLASLSPCVLPLVPINVAAIGASQARGARAVGLSARFVLGAAAALAVLGLVGDLAGLLLVEQRGPVLLLAGAALVYFGLAALELAPLPFPGGPMGGSVRLGPVAAGAAFALVTTPCASPLVAAVLTASGSTGVPGLAVVSMLSFAIGYTAIVFVTGAVGGSLVARLRPHSFAAPRAAAAALLLVMGLGFTAAGLAWF